MSRSSRNWQFLGSLAILAMFALSAPAQQFPPGKPAAVVNGEPILFSDLKALMDDRPSPVPVPKQQEEAMAKAALEVIIEDQIMRQFLRKTVAPIPAADVNKELASLGEVLKKQNKTYEQFLRETKQTDEVLRKDIASRLQWKAFLKARINDSMCKKYYDDNKIFFDKVTVRASHILVKLNPNASQAEKQGAYNKIMAIRQEIVAKKIDFGEAAKRYSDCPSKDKLGDIGYFPYKFVVVEPFARAAFSLPLHEVSNVVATDFGYHLIKVTDRTKGEASNFEQIKEGIREVYAQDVDLYSNIISEQRKTAKVEVYLK
ncbi:MAG: hypothetical protein FJ271_12870 [Planctomycetes bacterium]|nr:hypothetical protein [Planctomycetota bacterium]